MGTRDELIKKLLIASQELDDYIRNVSGWYDPEEVAAIFSALDGLKELEEIEKKKADAKL